MQKTAGKFNPADLFFYFLACGLGDFEVAKETNSHFLIAVNEIKDVPCKPLEWALNHGKSILVDSGAFAVASAHSKNHDLSLNETFRLPVNQLDGFEALKKKYLAIARAYQDDIWGIIELDLGGRDQKRKTRKAMEAQGIYPIPVYHPLNDGWDYFDELAKGYDRICVGNIVEASGYVRKRLLATLFERKKKYPSLWIHLLGYTPNETLCAFPLNSCDSSSWLETVRWDGLNERACLKSVGNLPKDFQYELGSSTLYNKGKNMGAFSSHCIERNMREFQDDLKGAGLLCVKQK